MAQEIEIEFKNLLSKSEFEVLLQSLPFPEKGKTQINYYFETEDFQLRKNHAALRIREKEGKYRLTLKEPHPNGLLETHDELTKEEALEWLQNKPIAKPETLKQLENLGIQIDAIKYFGSLATIRREYEQEGLIFVLDKSQYNNIVDYELEIESTDKESGLKAIEDILKQFNITKKDTPNKIARFFLSLEKS